MGIEGGGSTTTVRMRLTAMATVCHCSCSRASERCKTAAANSIGNATGKSDAAQHTKGCAQRRLHKQEKLSEQ
jgi:hypothetical protein